MFIALYSSSADATVEGKGDRTVMVNFVCFSFSGEGVKIFFPSNFKE